MPAPSASHPVHPLAHAWASTVIRRPLAVLSALLMLGAWAGYGTSQLHIDANQLNLISPDLREVKDVKRIIDMVGGSGFLTLALRGDDEPTLKRTADDVAARLAADVAHVRSLTYRMPVTFAQENMVLFIDTHDLKEIRTRVMQYLRALVRRANPFFIELSHAPEPVLDLQSFIDKYSHVGKKTIRDEYYISTDRKMVLLLIKPMWDTNELGRTHDYIDALHTMLADYSAHNAAGVTLVEDYARMGDKRVVVYGMTGSYKTSLDDSYAIRSSLEPVSGWAFGAIVGITVLFFRKLWPSLAVISGMALGTILTMGAAFALVGSLNMITSILGGILMGFGVDYGIHFVFRVRIELGLGKPYKQAIYDAMIRAGRPAFVAAIVTSGAFFVLCVSQFRGFSQFGLLAGMGTLIIGLTMFSWTAAILVVLGNVRAHWPEKLIGTQRLHAAGTSRLPARIPRPGWLLAGCSAVVLTICAFAVPWSPPSPQAAEPTSMFGRLPRGVRFNYNTRALMADRQYSVLLQDEINRRFQISNDPVAVYTEDLRGAREVFDELTQNPNKYSTIDQVVSIYSFVPPAQTAHANRLVLDAWQQELQGFDEALVPPAYLAHAELFKKALNARPYGVDDVPQVYRAQFYNLAQARPENRGVLTYIYPRVDLMDGQQMLRFADQIGTITCASGHIYHGAGSPLLYAALARTVLADGKLTVWLATAWILIMHLLDFRSIGLALASVVPLGVGLVMMLGVLNLTAHPLNFMNIIMLPILLGFGVSHGLYLLHRFLEGTSPMLALRSVGTAVAASTLTAMAGFASLFAASHNGLRSMGYVACVGLATTLTVSFTVLAAILQIVEDRRPGTRLRR